MCESITNNLKRVHVLLCVSATLGMAIFWGYKYSLDHDLCNIEYDAFLDGNDVMYPSMSMCFSKPFLMPKMKEYGINISRYLTFLRGDTTDVNLTSIDYDEITINLMDYYIEHYIVWKNGTKIKYETLHNSNSLIIRPSFNGFWYSEVFIKCFEIAVRSKEVDYFTILFNQEVFPNKTRPSNARKKQYGRKKSKESFLFAFHYPHQILDSSHIFKKYIWPEHKRNFNYKMI